MPTYEYECRTCGHTFEAFQSMADAPLKECPACGKEVRRLINGGAGIIFKGSGFYVNDSRSGSSSAPSKASPDAAAKPKEPKESAPAASTPADSPSKGKEAAHSAAPSGGAKAGAGEKA